MDETGSRRTVLLSGAGTPAGRRMVERLLAFDVRLVLLSRYADLSRFFEKKILIDSQRVMTFRMDPSRAKWLKLIARSVAARWGKVDAIISLADFEGGTSIQKLSHHQLMMQLRRNLFSPAALVHAMLPVLSAEPVIVLVSPCENSSPGSAISVEGLRGLARSLAAEMPQAQVSFLESCSAEEMAEKILHLL
jgi:NAD(P)-dependent dehydrogenase (short-subunit alcohol dehydrogenase family)